jgi:serine/threonine-protein kinase
MDGCWNRLQSTIAIRPAIRQAGGNNLRILGKIPRVSRGNSVGERQLRQACADLDERLRAGESCRAERFFSLYPLLACQEEYALELIYTEFVTREELAQRPTPEEFYARFPHWRRRLERQFQVHELLRDNLGVAEDTVADAAPPPPRRGPAVGQRLGRYELLEELACGGCGVVFRAGRMGWNAPSRSRPCDRNWRRRRSDSSSVKRPGSWRARHRHIMPVHDISEADGVLYFSMDFAASGSLALRIADRNGPPDAIAQAQDRRSWPPWRGLCITPIGTGWSTAT